VSLLEADVQAAFMRWLAADGWTVKTYPADQWLDVYAERRRERLLAEVKGKTSEPGIDADIAYGQLLFALAVPGWPRSVRAAARVPARVRALLRVTLYAVDDAGTTRSAPVSASGCRSGAARRWPGPGRREARVALRLEVVRLPGWTPRPAARAAARPWTKPKNAPLPSLPAGAAAAARPTVDP
jgi:hypothetical protein